MEHHKSAAQEIVELARRLARGQGDPHRLQAAVAALAGTLMQSQLAFLQEASGNPEVPQESIAEILQAFLQFDEGLETITRSIAASDRSGIDAGADVVERAAAVVRAAREMWQERLTRQGPTPFPFIGRILLHVGFLLRGGREVRYLRGVMADLPQFMERIREDVDRHDATVPNLERRAVAEQAAAEIRCLVERFERILQTGWDNASDDLRIECLERMRDDLVAAADRLAEVLAAYVESDLCAGPTPLALVNVVVRASEKWREGSVSPDETIGLVQHARREFADLRAPWSGDAAGRADLVESLMLDLCDAVRERDAAAAGMLVARLRDAAFDVAAVAMQIPAAEWDDEETLFDFVQGENGDMRAPRTALLLPANLQVAIDAAEMFLGGALPVQDFFEEVARLERAVMTARLQAHQAKDAAPLLEPTEAALNVLTEALDSMYCVATTRDHRALEAARSLMSQAAEALLAIAEVRPEPGEDEALAA